MNKVIYYWYLQNFNSTISFMRPLISFIKLNSFDIIIRRYDTVGTYLMSWTMVEDSFHGTNANSSASLRHRPPTGKLSTLWWPSLFQVSLTLQLKRTTLCHRQTKSIHWYRNVRVGWGGSADRFWWRW
jgi:hypothetical protein